MKELLSLFTRVLLILEGLTIYVLRGQQTSDIQGTRGWNVTGTVLVTVILMCEEFLLSYIPFCIARLV